MHGMAGHDRLAGGPGNDFLSGGAGNDTLVGGSEDDTLNGGSDDVLSNADGRDQFEGGSGSDWVSYEGSFGSLRIDLQFPTLNTFAAAGDTYDSIENVIGSQGRDNIRGTMNEGNHLIGGRNVDYIYGRSGDDTLDGSIGDDVLFGGVGADVLIGGAHRDRAQYSESRDDLTLDLADTGRNTGEAVGDSYYGIEDLAGGFGDDSVYGDAQDNRLFGRQGNDRIHGRIGDDYLNGGAHSDYLAGGAGNDTMRGGSHADTFVFNAGHDRIEDFDISHRDAVHVEDNNITVVRGMSGADVVERFGEVTPDGVLLDFGVQGSLLLEGHTSLLALNDEILVI
jgi:Ca2+-binding RTX toxin-like protein